MQIALLIVVALASVAVIGSVVLQESGDTGLGSIAGQSEKLFGKAKTTGPQATLKRITVVSSAVLVISILLYNVIG